MEFTFTKMLAEMAEKGFFLFGRIKKVPYLKRYGDNKLYNAAVLFIKRFDDIQQNK